MRVLVYPADTGGCGHYRLSWPAEVLRAAGHDVTVIPPASDDASGDAWLVTYRDDADGRPRVIDVQPPDADVVVLQRPLRRVMAEAIEVLQAKGVRVVVEIDDDFATIHPANPAFTGTHPRNDPDHNWNHLAHACRVADLVTVSTPALARRYGAHGRVAVLPNYVPQRYLTIPRHQGALSVIWSGNIANHPDDLQQVGNGVAQAVTATGAELRVVGSGKGVCHRLGLERGVACGWVPLDMYPGALAQATVGIVPLARTAFNEAKSWLKGLEMASVGVPFVASPTGPYRALHAAGIGLLAERPRDWRRLVTRLLVDEDEREDLAGRWRGTVAARFVLEDHAFLWWEAWRRALDARAVAA